MVSGMASDANSSGAGLLSSSSFVLATGSEDDEQVWYIGDKGKSSVDDSVTVSEASVDVATSQDWIDFEFPGTRMMTELGVADTTAADEEESMILKDGRRSEGIFTWSMSGGLCDSSSVVWIDSSITSGSQSEVCTAASQVDRVAETISVE